MKDFNAWSNGEVYRYRIEDENESFIASGCEYFDRDEMLKDIAKDLIGKEFRVQGSARHLEPDLRGLLEDVKKYDGMLFSILDVD